MKRIALSILGGVFVPSLYLMLFGVLAQIASGIFHLWRSPGFHRFGESLGSVLEVPIFWPSRIYFHFYPPSGELIAFSWFEPGNLLSLAVGNFALYAAVTYVILLILRRRFATI